MRSYLSAMVLSLVVLAFGITSSCFADGATPVKSAPLHPTSVNLKPVPHINAKCFSRLEARIDKHDNVFAFFQNVGATSQCRDMKYMPYQYWAIEIYGLDYKTANTVYHNFAPIAKAPYSISSVLRYLSRNKIICHHRADSVYWPYIAYYGCTTASRAKV